VPNQQKRTPSDCFLVILSTGNVRTTLLQRSLDISVYMSYFCALGRAFVSTNRTNDCAI